MKRFFYIIGLVLAATFSAFAQCDYFTTLTVGGIGNYSHGIKSDGTLWAWGSNNNLQLGDGTSINKNIPTQIGTGTDWLQVSVGGAHTLAIKSDGTLWAWGYNYNGRLGDGTATNRNTPTQIGLETDWVQVAAGVDHSMGIKSDGTLWAWGGNPAGQLGDGTDIEKFSPVQIGSGTDWVEIRAGYYLTLGIKSDGTLWAWGDNYYGQLGDGTTTVRHAPVQVGTDTDWVKLSVGEVHTLAIKSNGTLWAWGTNDWGRLGDGTQVNRKVPTRIGTLSNWVSVSAGGQHSLGMTADGKLWSWGSNYNGELGDRTNENKSIPTAVSTTMKWESFSARGGHSLGISSDGQLWAWGLNYSGELGDGTNTNRLVPTAIGPLPAFSAGLASSGNTVTARQGQYTMFNSACGLVASVNSNRNAIESVNGLVTAKVWVESTQPHQYVKRHYEITPASNAENATGRVKLYFTQAEFNDFNATHTMDLPANAGDAPGIARLRIEKRGGTSSDNTGLPPTYPGTPVTINPEDTDIVWNATAGRWEISFDVTGFSGFFVKTTENALPVRLLSFEVRESENTAWVQWKTSAEENASHFEIERSTDARKFVRIGEVRASGNSSSLQAYTFIDKHFIGLSGVAYYRLRSVDTDGSFALSQIKALQRVARANVYPNPGRRGASVTIESDIAFTDVVLQDMAGKKLSVPMKLKSNNQVEVDLANLASGEYIVHFSTSQGKTSRKLLVE